VVATPVQRHVEREGQKPHGADSLQAAYRFKASFYCGAECPSLPKARNCVREATTRTAGSDEMSLRPNVYVVPFGGHRSAPRVIAALAGVVHNPAGHEHNDDEDNQ
jgi:hypothetical protein